MTSYDLIARPIGRVSSDLISLADAPKQGSEGGPEAWIELEETYAPGLAGIKVGQLLIVVTWLHHARRDLLKVHPRDDQAAPLAGVFLTRSADRPNPIGLHPVTVKAIDGTRLRVGPLEAVDGTPVIDLKPVIGGE
ncbi:MAG: tRNA (N6-threonylcarbamoyladenosine(37)-N6)-methyltransferase TrmO [Gemmatimonadota bacterium]